jgi:hypothetical protein
VKLYNLNYKFTFNFKAIFLPTKENWKLLSDTVLP